MFPSSLLLFAALASAQCVPSPIPIIIGNVTLSNGQNTRGARVSVGTPPQELAFATGSNQNTTLVYGTDGYCEAVSNQITNEDGCITFRGGQYDYPSSSSSSASSVKPPINREGPSVFAVQDTLRLSPNATVLEMPLATAQSDWGEQLYNPTHVLGLTGSDSSLLGQLYTAGRIASKSWGFFWGRGFGNKQQYDGSLVLGGYDQAKTSGKEYNFPLSPNNPNCETGASVMVSDIQLNFPNGTDSSIFPKGGKPKSFCINPSLPALMNLPLAPYFSNWLNAIGGNETDTGWRSDGLYFWTIKYPSVPYNGDVTIKLESGMEVRVANERFVMPETVMDPETGGYVLNSSSTIMAVNSLQSDTQDSLPALGYIFFSSAYLFMNLDSGNFSMWSSFQTEQQSLVAVDANNKHLTNFCTDTAVNSTATAEPKVPDNDTGTNDDPGSSDEGDSTTTNIAAIAGGVAAGVVAIVAAVLITWLVMRKRRDEQPSSHQQENRPVHPPDYNGLYGGMTKVLNNRPQWDPPIEELDPMSQVQPRRYELA